jgi:glyoxylase-like metal-dependent hydrolase (beta-lactamase superfamily II)
MKMKCEKLTGFAIATFVTVCCHQAKSQGIDFARTQIATQQIAPNFFVLSGSAGVDPGHPEGAGGKIGLLVGPEGVLMVDAQYAPLTDKVLAAIKAVNEGPIRFLIDTHEHPDHTGGNQNFARRGAVIFAREEVRAALEQPPPPQVATAIGNAASFTDPLRLPVVTYGLSSTITINFDSETVHLIAVSASHTDGDTVVWFERCDVMMIGDFFRNYGYPFVDPTHGGSIAGVLQALDQVMSLAGPKTVLVPGHGTIVTKAELVPYRDMIVKVRDEVQRLINDGKSLRQVLDAKVTAPFDATIPGALTPLPAGFGTSADRFVSSIYTELRTAKR